jgi:hypothetical protein
VLQVAVERPSKDENGQPVHDLLDITPEGIRVPDRLDRSPDRRVVRLTQHLTSPCSGLENLMIS